MDNLEGGIQVLKMWYQIVVEVIKGRTEVKDYQEVFVGWKARHGWVRAIRCGVGDTGAGGLQVGKKRRAWTCWLRGWKVCSRLFDWRGGRRNGRSC